MSQFAVAALYERRPAVADRRYKFQTETPPEICSAVVSHLGTPAVPSGRYSRAREPTLLVGQVHSERVFHHRPPHDGAASEAAERVCSGLT